MKAVVCGSSGPKLDPVYPHPTPGPGEALLRVLLAGICSTDFEVAFGGYKSGFNGVLGHEFVAVIEVINVLNTQECIFSKGDRVVAEINVVPRASKSRNYYERAQDSERSALGLFGHDGVFAEFVCVPTENLHKVPSDLPNEVAVFTEPLAAACQVMEQVDIKPTSRVAVLGIGKLGVLVCLALRGCGKNVTGISRTGRHFGLLQARGIPTLRLDAALRAAKGEFDVVVECTGNADGFNSAVGIVRPYGTVVLKTTIAGKTQADLTSVVTKEISLVGSRCGPFVPALRLLSERQVIVDDLITDFFDLTCFPAAIARALQEDSFKVVMRIGRVP
eukprot:Plantae.Rhodophyta-Purpureofilum_apyrenoidigerum.ctg11957.p1 GENE.Plantae.Rhodophyta-Purpureofilum_apyrenoidigerum.ctg11957~~Plantae.Rhodophyta-Purpureofilum_apyrenoidigerum.ctg11957.p1  ORF type:complete len:333 (+),score=34.82 Plantae.Rhodophyta-Purpureofilum_apyrenoidigerum.ctg11957:91-1089(+)